MKFLADENISPKTVDFLRGLGYDCVHVREVGLKGKSDAEVMSFALNEARILLTIDRDFADVRNYPPGTHSGIIRLKLTFASSKLINAHLKNLLARLSSEIIERTLVISNRHRYRIKRKR